MYHDQVPLNSSKQVSITPIDLPLVTAMIVLACQPYIMAHNRKGFEARKIHKLTNETSPLILYTICYPIIEGAGKISCAGDPLSCYCTRPLHGQFEEGQTQLVVNEQQADHTLQGLMLNIYIGSTKIPLFIYLLSA